MQEVLVRSVSAEAPRPRDDSFDGLRALAAIWVLLVHAGYNGLVLTPSANLNGSGRGGVLLFFFLSAFLLGKPFFERRSRIWSLRSWAIFFARRIFRILPLYYAVLALELTFRMGIFAQQTDADRWSLFVDHVTFQKGMSVFWSLVVEWKFYLVFPLVALFASLFLWSRRGIFVLGALVLLWVSASVSGHLAYGLSTTLWIGPHAPVFICGALTAAVMARPISCSPTVRVALEVAAWVLGVGGILLSLPAFSGWLQGIAPSQFSATSAEYELFWTQRTPWIGFVMGAFFFCYSNGRGLMRRILSLGPLVHIGKIAFGIYLIHDPILHIVAPIPSLGGEVKLLATFALTLVLSALLYLTIEDPFIRLGQRLTRKLSRPDAAPKV